VQLQPAGSRLERRGRVLAESSTRDRGDAAESPSASALAAVRRRRGQLESAAVHILVERLDRERERVNILENRTGTGGQSELALVLDFWFDGLGFDSFLSENDQFGGLLEVAPVIQAQDTGCAAYGLKFDRNLQGPHLYYVGQDPGCSPGCLEPRSAPRNIHQ
jgi:hypothetical protein